MSYRDELVILLAPLRPRSGVEVGVHRGVTSEMLLRRFPRLTLVLVDPWRSGDFSSEYVATGDPCARSSDSELEEHYREAMRRVAPYAGRAVVTRATSAFAVATDPSALFDFVFIDADHSYAGCLGDLYSWWLRVRSGGLLICHDYGKIDHAAGVTQAVDEFAREHDVDVEILPCNLACLMKP